MTYEPTKFSLYHDEAAFETVTTVCIGTGRFLVKTQSLRYKAKHKINFLFTLRGLF